VTALDAIMQALSDQIQASLCGTATPPLIEDLQTTGFMNIDPTPPSIDVYPGDPSQDALTFGTQNNEFSFVVRARVTTADHEAGQKLLLSMMDPGSTTSVARAIKSDKTLGSKVSALSVAGPSGFGIFNDRNGEGSYLGCTWTVRVMP
jgi:hypothetical protein